MPIYSKHLLDAVVLLTLFVNLCRYSARTIDALQRMDLDMKELDLDLIHNLIRHIVFREDVSTWVDQKVLKLLVYLLEYTTELYETYT